MKKILALLLLFAPLDDVPAKPPITIYGVAVRFPYHDPAQVQVRAKYYKYRGKNQGGGRNKWQFDWSRQHIDSKRARCDYGQTLVYDRNRYYPFVCKYTTMEGELGGTQDGLLNQSDR